MQNGWVSGAAGPALVPDNPSRVFRTRRFILLNSVVSSAKWNSSKVVLRAKRRAGRKHHSYPALHDTSMPKDFALRLQLRRWEDGQLVEEELDHLDRWAVHAAERLTAVVGDVSVRVLQRPHDLSGSHRLGVGACLWDGALILAGYLASAVPRHRLVGARVVELGAGVGLAGIVCAKLGACVTVTEREQMMGLLRENVVANGFDERTGADASGGPGSCRCEELTWGAEGADHRAESMGPADWVIAADCVYIDGEGVSPSVPLFVQTARLLSGPATRVLVCQEVRSADVSRQLRAELVARFPRVEEVPASTLPPAYRQTDVELFACGF